ncbi:MAG TPA: cupin-like domain-containing protein [Casimicrobiaceae bacterium]|nr:cupin-like domain-containing protein [Casimicrobiaceae bacterium]
MNDEPGRIAEWHDVNAATFRDEIVPRYCPAVLRGLVAQWPAVQHAKTSIEAIGHYLNAFDKGSAVDFIIMAPHVDGRMFYTDDMRGFNFSRSRAPIGEISDKLMRYAKFEKRPSLVVQSALIADCLPGFPNENRLPILDESVLPRIWLGNAVTTPAHFDESNNVACVVSGRRHFTLFPPEQIANLYIGPLGHAPTATPISLVSLANPDFTRFPRFRDALAAALVADLEPGDAIYIPTLWWHHVQSLAKYNILVNYWWKGHVGADASSDTALNCLLHCLLTLKHLPAEHRQVWKTIFDHYVFSASAESVQHIPVPLRGVLGEISPELAKQVKAFLVSQLQR